MIRGITKKVFDLTDDEILKFLLTRCNDYISKECNGCPLKIEDYCWNDIRNVVEHRDIEVFNE